MDENNSTTPELSTLERQLLTQIDGLVTERNELQTKCFDLTTEQEQLISYANNSALIKAKDALIDALKTQVDEDEVEQGIASVIFAEFANSLDRTDAWTNPFKKKFTVKVSHNNDIVMTITGVQAEDEDDAIEIVTEAISIDSPVRKGTLTYDDKNGDSDDTPDLEEDDSRMDKDDFDLDYEAEEA